MNNLHIKKGDTVMINSGVDKGKKGKVLEARPKDNKVIVEGINMRTRHVKPKKQGEPGGLIKSEIAINASKANLYCNKCGKGVRTRVEVKKDGSKTRICSKCGEDLK